MEAMEIILLIAGAVIFTVSFFVPEIKRTGSDESKSLAKEEIKAMVSQEMSDIRGHVEEVVDETITYAVEKTERSLERLTNEKIMAVNEYSDTVIKEIQKNHEEVVFLYDMLNSKHTNLKETVSQVNKSVKEAEETTKEVEAVVNSFQKIVPDAVATTDKVQEQTPMDISFMQSDDGVERNNNDKILELHKQGKSNVAIAKELGLGVGEVKLVIDLYKNM